MGDNIAFKSTLVNNNSATNKSHNTSTAVNNNKFNNTATAANNKAVVALDQANTSIHNCSTLPTESQPSVNPEYQHNNINGKGNSIDQHYHQFRDKSNRSDEKLQLLRQHLRTPQAMPSVKPNNNNPFTSPSTNNTATERDMKRTEYHNIKGKGSTEYNKRKGASSNDSDVESEINQQITTATQQNNVVNIATKQCDQVPRVQNKDNQQLPRVNNQMKLEQHVSVPRVIANHTSSVEKQQRSDSNNKSIQQQLPPILHDNKLPVIKKLDGKVDKAEKWQIACENGFGRMIKAEQRSILLF